MYREFDYEVSLLDWLRVKSLLDEIYVGFYSIVFMMSVLKRETCSIFMDPSPIGRL